MSTSRSLCLSYLKFTYILGRMDCFSSKLGCFQMFSSRIFFLPLSSLEHFLQGLILCFCWYAWRRPGGLWALLIFRRPFLFLLFRPDNLYLALSLLILPTSSNLLLSCPELFPFLKLLCRCSAHSFSAFFFKLINFLLNTDLNAFHHFWYVIFSLCSSKHLISIMSSSFTHGLLNFYMQDFTNSLFVINFHLHCIVVKEDIPYDSYHLKCETCFKPQKMITFINFPCVTETTIQLESSMRPVGQTG